MRGRPTCPTGQKKYSVGATAGSPLFLLLQGKVGYRIAPSSDPASPAHLPPKGKALGREEPSVADFRPSQGPEQNPICFLHGHAPGKKLFSPRECRLRRRGSGCIPQFWEPSAAGPKIPTFPSPPSWGAGRYGRWVMGRRPGRKKERTPTGSPQPEKVGPGRKNLFLPGVLSSGFLPKKAGLPPGAGRETTPQVWTCEGSIRIPCRFHAIGRRPRRLPASPGQGKGSPGRPPAGWSPATGPGR